MTNIKLTGVATQAEDRQEEQMMHGRACILQDGLVCVFHLDTKTVVSAG